MLSVIQANAKRINELQTRIDETFQHRDESPEGLRAWKDACAQAHQEYGSLAFPGGYAAGLEKIKRGDVATIEVALLYLEHTPYCFRSQYVATTLSRALNKVPLPEPLASRFIRWKETKKKRRSQRILLRRSAQRGPG
jgi:hypothetical protein